MRSCSSVTGVVISHARPRLRVSDGVMRQSSSTKGRIIFQRRPVTGAVVGLVVFAQSGHPHQQVGLGIAAEESFDTDNPEAVLKCFRADVHLIGAKIDAGVNFVLAADQVEIVLEGEDIRSTLKRGVAAIAERPIAALRQSVEGTP